MRFALLLIPYLMRALIYIGIILVAAPLRMVFSALPNPERGQREMTAEEVLSSYPPSREGYSQDAIEGDLTDIREWAQTAKTTIEELIKERDFSRASHNADYKDLVELRGFAATRENQLSLTSAERDAALRDAESNRVRGLAIAEHSERAIAIYQKQLPELEEKLREQRARADAMATERDQERERANVAEKHLSELHISIRQALSAESTSEALGEAAVLKEKLDVVSADRDLCASLATQYEFELEDRAGYVDALEVELAHLESIVDEIGWPS